MNQYPFQAACKNPAQVGRLRQYQAAPACRYPEVINLPFNRQALPDGCILHPTPQKPPEEIGYWVLLQGGNLLLQPVNNQLELPCGPRPAWLPDDLQPLWFADLQGKPVAALTVPSGVAERAELSAEPFNAFRETIDPDLMTCAGIGKQLLHWQRLSRHCSICASPLTQLPDSWGKKCTGCGHEHFPQIHPCAIVLIRRDDQLLLIRKPEWPQGRYSLVAGFLDVGESLEECAIREALEETGVSIKNVQYVASQCWPFPSQVMVGFTAEYAFGDIKVDGKEIDDARWFTIGSLPSLPARRSIARFLIDSCNG